MNTTPQPTLTTAELVKLGAVNNVFFEKTFFPKAARQESAPFHAEMWNLLEDPSIRFLNLLCFRDSAKTTKCRIYTGKRIAYNLSKTILYVGANEGAASRSIQWIRSRIEERMDGQGNKKRDLYGQVFNLSKGKKWNDVELEIFHGVDAQPIWVYGVGITGTNVRGINFDDYRPDLIVLDDILTDENGSSKEQRDSITNLVMSALKNSLAPRSDAPNAKLIMLNTPQDADDVSAHAENDPDFVTKRFPCWTPETMGLPVEQQISSWPARVSTEERRKEKRNATTARKLSTFIKEKEVRIATKENAIFDPQWIKFYDNPAMVVGQTVIFIDPTPPADGKKGQKEINRLDFEVVGAMRRNASGYFLLDYEMIQGTNPSWTCAKFFEMIVKWQPYKAVVEGNAYQKTLKWILEQEMAKRQRWITVDSPTSLKAKPIRISASLHGPLSNGRFHVRPEHVEAIEQITKYPGVEHDDLIDGMSMGVVALTNAYVEMSEAGTALDNTNIKVFRQRRQCP